jgi:hypothetical protein
MTPAVLRYICKSLDPGGQTKLARLLGWNPSTIRRKLSGKSKIRKDDELAIQKVMSDMAQKPVIRPLS